MFAQNYRHLFIEIDVCDYKLVIDKGVGWCAPEPVSKSVLLVNILTVKAKLSSKLCAEQGTELLRHRSLQERRGSIVPLVLLAEGSDL